MHCLGLLPITIIHITRFAGGGLREGLFWWLLGVVFCLGLEFWGWGGFDFWES